MSTSTLSLSAFHAIKAVDVFRRCGRFAAMQYAKKNDCIALYRLARQLSAVN